VRDYDDYDVVWMLDVVDVFQVCAVDGEFGDSDDRRRSRACVQF